MPYGAHIHPNASYSHKGLVLVLVLVAWGYDASDQEDLPVAEPVTGTVTPEEVFAGTVDLCSPFTVKCATVGVNPSTPHRGLWATSE